MSFAKDDIGLTNISSVQQAGILKTRIVKEASGSEKDTPLETENIERLSFSDNLNKKLSGITDSLEQNQEGLVMLVIADNSFSSVSEIISEVKKQIKGLDGNASEDDFKELTDSIKKQLEKIDETVKETQFNGQNLLDGSFQGSKNIEDRGKTVDISTEFKDTSLKALGLPEAEDLEITNKEQVEELNKKLEKAAQEISKRQANVSSHQNEIHKNIQDLFLTEINLLKEDNGPNGSIANQIKSDAINGILNDPSKGVEVQIKNLDEDILLALIRLHT